MHARWLTAQKFAHPAHQIVFQDQIEAINAAQVRLTTLVQQLRDTVPTWTMAPGARGEEAGISEGNHLLLRRARRESERARRDGRAGTGRHRA